MGFLRAWAELNILKMKEEVLIQVLVNILRTKNPKIEKSEGKYNFVLQTTWKSILYQQECVLDLLYSLKSV